MEDKNGNNGNGNGDAPAKPEKAPPQASTPESQGRSPEPQMPPQGYQAPPPGYYYPPPPGYYPPPPRPKKRKSSKPKVVGSLLVVVAILGFATGAGSIVGMAFFSEFSDWFPGEGDTLTLEGRVTSLNGTGLADAVVLVVDEGLSTTTDGEGYYVIYNVPVGDQTIRCSLDGYVTIDRKVTVTGDIFSGQEPDGPGHEFVQTVDFAMSEGTGSVETGRWIEGDMFDFRAIWLTCSVIILVASSLALLGAVYAFKRTNLMFVLIGCVAGIFTMGFFIGTVLAFIALFILLLSLDEFRNGNKKDEETE